MRGRSSSGLRRLLRSLRRRVESSDRLLEDYVKRLASAYPRATILLFGSRARGDSLPYSDYDIAIVLPEPECEDKIGRAVEARSMKPRGISVDVVILCESELEDPIVRRMLEKSVVLHPRLG